MASYNYVDTPNSNLICCICRMPFTDPATTRACAHTFCHDCIVRAIGHSPQCPVDRSPLVLDDLLPANPIVRSLVDELAVECIHRSAGCTHTCQRQLLPSHLRDTCQYSQIACSEGDCDRVVLRRDAGKHAHNCVHRLVECDGCGIEVKFIELDSHQSNCSATAVTCGFCSSEMRRSDLVAHNSSCPDFVIPCSQVSNGCPWIGPRVALSSSHLPLCPYETIKGFFPLNSARMSTLTEENLVLRSKIDALEGLVQSMKHEMQAVKTALGPWYRPDGTFIAPSQASFDPPGDAQPSASSTSRRFSYGPDTSLSPPPSASLQSFPGAHISSNIIEHDVLAPYFPSENEEVLLPAFGRTQFDLQGPNPNQTRRSVHRMSSSISQAPDPSMSYSLHPRPATQNPVAPINLSTTLEGSLGSLRESLVTLAASVDSLGRRNDIALTNETLRLNEEVMSLRANVHGLRMQVHAIMMDRNAQVTGRMAESPQTEGSWPPQARFYYPQAIAPTAPSITKL